MATRKLNIKKLALFVTALITGLTAAPPAGLTSIGVGGKSFLISDLIAQLKAYLAMLQAVLNAEAALAAAHDALDPEVADLTLFVQQTSTAIKGALGKKNSTLRAYGLKPNRTPAPLTVEQSTAKVAKMKATRAARHTMGKRQREAIKGEVAPTPTPTPEPAPVPPIVPPVVKTGA